ncbi:MAG: sodium/proton-translocating pyrophosphatase, partial [Bacteroidota bacterium]
EEVRRQFANIPELRAALDVMRKYDGDLEKASEEDMTIFHAADGKAEYAKCVEISTTSSIREMVLPGLLAIAAPVAVGFIGGPEMLGGLLAGVTASGVLMAIFQSNAGGAWDNAKKMFEEGVDINGEKHFKGSDAHKAAVVGDTVGDPFKDTSGPSLNILLKLMSVVALVIAPTIALELDTDESAMLNVTPIEQSIIEEEVAEHEADATLDEETLVAAGEALQVVAEEAREEAIEVADQR